MEGWSFGENLGLSNPQVPQLQSRVGLELQLQRHFNKDRGLTFKKFLQTLRGLTDKKLRRDGIDVTFTHRTLLVAGMHFQDAYSNAWSVA